MTATYGYDLSGNLMAGSGWTYNTSNQITAAPVKPGLSGASSFGYDASGNITSLSGVTLGYDVWGNMTSAGSATYTYDSSGRRVSKTVGGVTTYYLWDGDLLMAEENSSGVVTHSYTWGPAGLISDRVGGVTRFYLYDAQGNTRALLDSSGNLLGRATYSAWGSVLYSTMPANVPFGWQGAEGAYTDAETGLVYLHHRYYAPGIGRFLTRDPSGFSGGINLYAYCYDDPLNYHDPLGLDAGDSVLPQDANQGSDLMFHPGMKAGSGRSSMANQMLTNFEFVLGGAAFGAAGDGVGLVSDEAVATMSAYRARTVSEGDLVDAYGVTDPYGNIIIQRGLSARRYAEVLAHEMVHSFLSPEEGGWLNAMRAKFGVWGYKNIQLIRYIEEAWAQTAGLNTLGKGLGLSLKHGLQFPSEYKYVRMGIVYRQAGVYVGGVAYGMYEGYHWANHP